VSAEKVPQKHLETFFVNPHCQASAQKTHNDEFHQGCLSTGEETFSTQPVLTFMAAAY